MGKLIFFVCITIRCLGSFWLTGVVFIAFMSFLIMVNKCIELIYVHSSIASKWKQNLPIFVYDYCGRNYQRRYSHQDIIWSRMSIRLFFIAVLCFIYKLNWQFIVLSWLWGIIRTRKVDNASLAVRCNNYKYIVLGEVRWVCLVQVLFVE